MARMFSKTKSPTHRLDLVAGSERMLKVYHKNTVHLRCLQRSITDLDFACRKKLNRVQQEIFNIYYDEFLPIKRQADRLCFPRPLVPQRIENSGKYPNDVNRKDSLSSSLSVASDSQCCVSASSDLVLPTIPQRGLQPTKCTTAFTQNNLADCSITSILALPPINRASIEEKWRKHIEQQIPYDSDSEDTPRISSAKTKVIKNAIALTSQPAKEKSRKTRPLRSSFLMNLKKQHKAVWEREVVLHACGDKYVYLPKKKTSNKESPKHYKKIDIPKIMLENEEIESTSQYLLDLTENHFIEPVARVSTSTLLSDHTEAMFPVNNDHTLSRLSRVFAGYDNEDGSYYSETPDFFSEIHEESSFSDGSYDNATWSSSCVSIYSDN